jgi:hypothetical protein
VGEAEDSTSLVLKRKDVLLTGKLERQLEYSTSLALKKRVGVNCIPLQVIR